MAGVITAFTIILSIIAVGYALSRFGVIGSDSQRLVLNKTAFYAATPCLLFTSLAKSDPGTLFSPVLAAVVASACSRAQAISSPPACFSRKTCRRPPWARPRRFISTPSILGCR